MNDNGAAWQTGHCGYCGTRFEEMEAGHVKKCMRWKAHAKSLLEKDPAYQIKRVADQLAQISRKLPINNKTEGE